MSNYRLNQDIYRKAWMRNAAWQGLEDEFNRRQLLGEDCALLIEYMLTVVKRRYHEQKPGIRKSLSQG